MTGKESTPPGAKDTLHRAPDANGSAAPVPDDAWTDWEMMLGPEAAVRPGEYGPPIPSRLPSANKVTKEVRELERRIRARVTPAFPIERRRNLPLESVWRRYRRLAMRRRSVEVDDFGRDHTFADRVEPLLNFLHSRYFRVDVQGAENVPATGPAILVANHAGTVPYDVAMIMQAVKRQHPHGQPVRPLIEDSVFHFPFVGPFLNRLGAVRACQRNARRLLDAGNVVAVFPEGIQGSGKLFRDRYRLQRFGRGGFVKLAIHSRAPIIPVAIVGAEEAQPLVARLPRISRRARLPFVPVTPTFPLLGPAGLLPLPTRVAIGLRQPMDLASTLPPEALRTAH